MKEPRWVTPFLRALERTGEVRAAAQDAGIDWSTAYARRRAHAEFAAAWDEALKAHAAAKAEAEDEEVQSLTPGRLRLDKLRTNGPLTLPGAPGLPSPARGEGIVASAGQVRRVGHGRWSERKEKIFFEELAATANVKRAAAAAGVSPNAVYARRLKHPLFKAKWVAVLETGRAAIEMHLVEAANRSFDTDELDTGEVEPKVSIDQAIKITQGSTARARRDAPPNPFEAEDEPDPVDEVQERLIRKLRRLRERDIAEKQAAGWSYDESFDMLIPPGWVMGADYRPKEPEG